MTAIAACEAKTKYLNERKKLRDDSWRERLRAGKGSSFDDADYTTGDLTPPWQRVNQTQKGHQQQRGGGALCVESLGTTAKAVGYWRRVRIFSQQC
jgi:hypothetical protein